MGSGKWEGSGQWAVGSGQWEVESGKGSRTTVPCPPKLMSLEVPSNPEFPFSILLGALLGPSPDPHADLPLHGWDSYVYLTLVHLSVGLFRRVGGTDSTGCIPSPTARTQWPLTRPLCHPATLPLCHSAPLPLCTRCSQVVASSLSNPSLACYHATMLPWLRALGCHTVASLPRSNDLLCTLPHNPPCMSAMPCHHISLPE